MLEGGASADINDLGVRCGAEGLFLARAALIERHGTEYRLRSSADLEQLLRAAYGGRITVEAVDDGLARIAAALNRNRMWAAQSEAASLALADLPNPIAALRLEIEDLRLAAEPLREELLRAGWDPQEHPRAGVPPNPGWFAPVGGAGVPTQVAQGEEDERAPEEMLDPTAPLRQAQWDAAIATLRRIDPTLANPICWFAAKPG